MDFPYLITNDQFRVQTVRHPDRLDDYKLAHPATCLCSYIAQNPPQATAAQAQLRTVLHGRSFTVLARNPVGHGR